MHTAVGQLPNQPTIHSPKRQLPSLCSLPCSSYIVENPRNLAGGKISVNQQSSPFLNQRLVPLRLKLVTKLRRTPVLPNNRVVNRLARFAVPYNRCLALIGDSNRRHITRP